MRPPASATRFGDKTEGGAQGKIVIAIAHRLSTIAAMDRLIVLEEGDIAETGTPTAAWSCERREAQESDPRRRRRG